jgi:hypothetical protein
MIVRKVSVRARRFAETGQYGPPLPEAHHMPRGPRILHHLRTGEHPGHMLAMADETEGATAPGWRFLWRKAQTVSSR